MRKKALLGIAGVATGAIILTQALKGRAPGEKPKVKQPRKRSVPSSSSAAKMWVNTERGVFHPPESRWYGKTAHGEYMTEADALAAGYRPVNAGSGGRSTTG